MSKNSGLQSLFSQKLDRALFAAYFVGAVVPMGVLAWLVHAYSLPALTEQGFATATVMGVLSGAGMLVLAGYFATRRIAQRALARMDADNAGLSQLLTTSRALSKGAHAEEVAGTAAACAATLVGANAAYVVTRDEKGESEIHVLGDACSGAGKLSLELESELNDVAAMAIDEDRTASITFERVREGQASCRSTAVAVPIPAESMAGALVVLRDDPVVDMFEQRELDALVTLAGISSVALDNADMQHTQRNFFAHVTDMLVIALDSHVEHRSGHATRVAELANRVAREMSLDEDVIRRLHFGALLHDLGMLKIERENQRIPKFFQKHPAIGARMLSRIRVWHEAAPIVLHHHENFDGSGYPKGLVGEEIPIESRVVLVVDAFDAMMREDYDRPAMSLAEALQELRDGMGTQFDPAVVRAFLELVQRGEIDLEPRR